MFIPPYTPEMNPIEQIWKELRARGFHKVQSGEMLRVCMTSDFFLEEADPWRDEA